MANFTPPQSSTATVSWRAMVKPYITADTWRSIWQNINSMVPFAIVFYLMYRSLSVSYGLTLALLNRYDVPAGADLTPVVARFLRGAA